MELSARGIDVGLHYPIPLHLQAVHKNLGYTEGAFPMAENSASTLFVLHFLPITAQCCCFLPCFGRKIPQDMAFHGWFLFQKWVCCLTLRCNVD